MPNPGTGARWIVATIASISITMVYPARAASVAPTAAENGMVVSAQHLATDVGVEVLKKGGNAVDAAIAVGYALAVVFPAAGNLGGGGFMTIDLADGRKTFLDFREAAPKKATANMYLDKDGNVIKGLSTKGHLAVGVPGTVSGLEYAREKYGMMKRADLITPAILLAEQGFVLDQGDVDLLQTRSNEFHEDPGMAAIFLNKGQPFQVGEKLVQPELAETLREISNKGTDGFYKGWVGAAIAASSQAGKGLITQEDLDSYKTRELKPVECDYRGYHVISAPPPSSGGVVICEILNILEGYNLKVEYRFLPAEGASVDTLATELVKLGPKVIVTAGTAMTVAAQRATTTIPIVMAPVADPLRAGIVKSLAHPGGNVTGTMLYGLELDGKRLDVFKQAVPAIARIAVLGNAKSLTTQSQWLETQRAAGSLGLEARLFTVQDPAELSATFEIIAQDSAYGVVVLPDPLLNGVRKTIITLAAAHRLPVIYEDREFVQDGGLISYGPNIADMTRRSAAFVDKILKGAKPSELPIEQPTQFELVINLRTAKELGLTIPDKMLTVADEVIE